MYIVIQCKHVYIMWPLNFTRQLHQAYKKLNWVLIWVKENSVSMHSEESFISSVL